MIVYKDILQKLKVAGYNTSYLREHKIISESTLMKIRKGIPIGEIKTIDRICQLLHCQPSDIIEIVEDTAPIEQEQELNVYEKIDTDFFDKDPYAELEKEGLMKLLENRK